MKLTKVSVFAISALIAAVIPACKNKSDQPTEASAVKVSVCVVSGQDYTTSTSYSGTVEAAQSATVSFSVPGTISQLLVSEGQSVAKGTLLGRLSDDDYVYANNMAQAQLAEAQDAYNRLKKLHDSNSLPDIKWVEIQQKLKQAENSASLTEHSLNETKLYSPIAGVVSRKLADVGQNVAPIQPVYEIVTADELTIAVSVPENDIDHFAIGQQASVEFASEAVGTLEGKVTEKAVVADPLTRSYKVKVSLPAGQKNLLPGMVGTVRFAPVATQAQTDKAILLPSQAVILDNDNQTFVWVVKNQRAERRPVKVNELVPEGIAVESGLTPGDTVIVAGMQKVGTGTLVETVIK